MKIKHIIFAFIFSLSLLSSFAQQFAPCGTDEYLRQLQYKYPESVASEEQLNETISAHYISSQIEEMMRNKTGKVLYVPVVFHVIHENGLENISQAQIMDQIRIINEDFRKKAGTNGASTDPLAADMEIEFRLAQYDPNGNKHDGINRIFSTNTNAANDNVKSLSYWDARRYLNIWVVKTIALPGITSGTVLGYAQFPWMLNFQVTTDGIVIRSDQVGIIGTGRADQGGRTLTHEIGHWLGLYHTFQNGCVGNTTSNCASAGDRVCDTPPVSEASFGCNVGQNSCTNDVPDRPDMIRNYMDYSDGTCMNTYSNGQKIRVWDAAQMNLRSGIFGTKPNNIQNIAYAGLQTDGTYIPVQASAIKAPYFYGFENQSVVADGWRINNFNIPSNGWSLKPEALNGSQSIGMYNFTNPNAMLNSRDGFQSPEIDLSTVAEPYLEFWYAFAQRTFANNDQFVVRISNNFGMEETILFDQSGANLSTGGIVSTAFTPAISNWRKISINLSAYKSFTNARIRFEFLNRRGNNIFVDNFAITNGPTSVSEAFKSSIGFAVWPNPATNRATITFTLQKPEHIQIILVDMMGKEVRTMVEKELNTDKQELEVDLEGLTKGMYFIRLSSDQQAFSHKLLIN